MLVCGVLQYTVNMIFDSFISYELTMLLIVLGLGLVFSSSTTNSDLFHSHHNVCGYMSRIVGSQCATRQ